MLTFSIEGDDRPRYFDAFGREIVISDSLSTTLAATGHTPAPSIATYSGAYRALEPEIDGGALPVPDAGDRIVTGRGTLALSMPARSFNGANGTRRTDAALVAPAANGAGWPWWLLMGVGVIIGLAVSNGR